MTTDAFARYQARRAHDRQRHHRAHVVELPIAVLAGCAVISALVQLLSGHTHTGLPTLTIGVIAALVALGVVAFDHRGGAS